MNDVTDGACCCSHGQTLKASDKDFGITQKALVLPTIPYFAEHELAEAVRGMCQLHFAREPTAVRVGCGDDYTQGVTLLLGAMTTSGHPVLVEQVLWVLCSGEMEGRHTHVMEDTIVAALQDMVVGDIAEPDRA